MTKGSDETAIRQDVVFTWNRFGFLDIEYRNQSNRQFFNMDMTYASAGYYVDRIPVNGSGGTQMIIQPSRERA